MKVAIIGAGPRGLWAAESLMERARQRGGAIELTVFSDMPLYHASAPGAFAQDLRVLGSKNATQKAHTQRQGVLLKWARDFALGSYASSQAEPTS